MENFNTDCSHDDENIISAVLTIVTNIIITVYGRMYVTLIIINNYFRDKIYHGLEKWNVSNDCNTL